MVRDVPRLCALQERFPHARGDGPDVREVLKKRTTFSPRTWGWSVQDAVCGGHSVVFPTHVGMVRSPRRMVPGGRGFPHARGDGPKSTELLADLQEFSPRTWGWSGKAVNAFGNSRVFPTHVGMVRRSHAHTQSGLCFPHARGDGPWRDCHPYPRFRFSPRTWGWSAVIERAIGTLYVFPTHVGMVRMSMLGIEPHQGFPHARGDGPSVDEQIAEAEQFSPRTWGWSVSSLWWSCGRMVFPTHVGMVRTPNNPCSHPARFPHARGDGPALRANGINVDAFSPRTWGWSVPFK